MLLEKNMVLYILQANSRFIYDNCNGIFFSKIVITYCEKKIVLVIEKNFLNSRLKADNLQKF